MTMFRPVQMIRSHHGLFRAGLGHSFRAEDSRNKRPSWGPRRNGRIMAHVALLSRCSSNPSTKTASCVGRGGTAWRSPVSDTCSLSPQHGTRLFGSRGRCSTASVKHLAQRSAIHAIVGADGDDPGPWFSAIPCIPNGDIHALADHLKDDPSARCFGCMHHAFAAVHAGRELAHRFPQRFQGQRRAVS